VSDNVLAASTPLATSKELVAPIWLGDLYWYFRLDAGQYTVVLADVVMLGILVHFMLPDADPIVSQKNPTRVSPIDTHSLPKSQFQG